MSFLWNVSKIFGHGIISRALGLVRFAFAMLTPIGFVGAVVMAFKGWARHNPEAWLEAGACVVIAFLAFVANVAIATMQRKLREALDRSIAGPQEPQEAARQDAPAYAAPASTATIHGPFPAARRTSGRTRTWR